MDLPSFPPLLSLKALLGAKSHQESLLSLLFELEVRLRKRYLSMGLHLTTLGVVMGWDCER